jgi:hypothetical protein
LTSGLALNPDGSRNGLNVPDVTFSLEGSSSYVASISEKQSPASPRLTSAFALLVVLMIVTAMPAPAQTFTVLHNFYGPDGFYPTSGLTTDRSGSLYGTFNQGCSACGFDGGVSR